MDKGDIIWARWIKPVARRAPHQTCGYAIFMFQTPQTANEVLVNGMFVQQKKIYAEKCKGSHCDASGVMDGDTWCMTAQHQLIPVGRVRRGTGLTHVLTRPSPTVFHAEGQDMRVGPEVSPCSSTNAARLTSGWRTTSCHTFLQMRHGPKFESPPRSYTWRCHCLQRCTSLRGTEQHQCNTSLLYIGQAQDRMQLHEGPPYCHRKVGNIART